MAGLRIVLAEPNVLLRSLLHASLEPTDAVLVGEPVTVAALLAIAETERPDVVVTNTDLADGPVDGAVEGMVAAGANVVVITADRSPERLAVLLELGVTGYLLHDIDATAVADAVRVVANGGVALHPVAASTVVHQWRLLRRGGHPFGTDRHALTPRELDVLSAMTDGLGAKAIARRLGVAVKTVENHKTRVFDKLGVRTQAHAVARAIGEGLLTSVSETSRSSRDVQGA